MSASKITLSIVALLAIILTLWPSAATGNIAAWFQIILPVILVGGMFARAHSAKRDEAQQLASDLQAWALGVAATVAICTIAAESRLDQLARECEPIEARP